MKVLILLSIACLSFYGAAQKSILASQDSLIYRQSIQNAMYPEESKVSNTLVPIVKNNKGLTWKTIEGEEYVLMLSWKGYIDPYMPYKDTGYYNTGDQWPIWVTASPELLQRMRGERYADASRRLKELLGLPPNSSYTHFVEFWVKPADLFRPCPDNEINDTECDVCFPDGTDSTYMNWVNQTRIDRYYPCELYQQYPWTALGYTYDWNVKNASHLGLSEFVIRNSSLIKVAGIYTTEEYLRK